MVCIYGTVEDSIVEATEPHLSASDQVRNLNRGQMDDDGPWGRTEKVENTLPETNIAPENRPSQKETSIPTIHF